MAYTKTNWVNGTTPLNDKNMNKIESGIKNNDINIGEENYDNTKTYEVGDIVRYNEKIYKCITAITTAENFDSNKWEQTNIVEIVQSEKSKIYELIEAISTPIVGEGENITLNDTAEKRFENFDIEGNSEQEATPSPDYPSEVKSCGSNVNLFDKDTHTLDNTFETRVQTDYILLKKGTYTLNFIGADSFYLIIFNENKVKVKETDWTEKNSSFELDNKYYVVIVFRENNNIALNKDEVVNIKLVEGTEVGEYSPYGQGCINVIIDNGLETTDANYKSQIYTIPVQQPMRSIGDIRDKFILKENGKWFERHYIARKIFDGTEEWYYTQSSSGYNRFSMIIDKAKTSSKLMSNIAINEMVNKYGISSINENKYLYFYIDLTDVNNWKAYLQEQYNAGTPVYVDYILETPTDIECTSEQTEILNQIYIKAKSYKGVTHIYGNDEVSPNCYVEAVKDLTTLIQ